MKTAFFIFCAVVMLLLAGVYVFIPATLTVSSTSVLHGTTAGVVRTLHNKDSWNEVWQEGKHFTQASSLDNSNFFWYRKDTFYFNGLLQNAVKLTMAQEGGQIPSELTVFSYATDSVALHWGYSLQTSKNPFTRLQQYRQAITTKNSMMYILRKLTDFLSEDKNIYGISIVQTSTRDTFLISTKKILQSYPSTEQIYALVDRLQKYAKENNCLETGYPMMNVSRLDKNDLSVMIALPVDKSLSGNGDIEHKQMVPGRFLTTIVTGGTETVNNAYLQMQQYFQDYERTSMAIPFMYLVTDRNTNKDSSQWITKLYFPVM